MNGLNVHNDMDIKLLGDDHIDMFQRVEEHRNSTTRTKNN